MSYIPIEPVTVWEGNAVRRVLNDIEGAANHLLLRWPEEFMDTPLHRDAQVAALDALSGHGTAINFRDAFVAAATEAGIIAEDEAMPSHKLPAHIARPWDFQKRKRRR